MVPTSHDGALTPPQTRNVGAVRFAGSGGDVLAAHLDVPVGPPLAFALFAHCFTCSKDFLAASRISRGLVEEGFAVLRFDFTALGASEGEFADTNFSSNVDDLVCAAGWLREHHAAPSLLVGHSLGGTAVLAAAARLPEVTAVATIGAPFDPAHVAALFPAATLAQLDHDGTADVTLAGRTFKVRSQLLDDLNAQNLANAIHDLRRALVVFHSPHRCRRRCRQCTPDLRCCASPEKFRVARWCRSPPYPPRRHGVCRPGARSLGPPLRTRPRPDSRDRDTCG